MAGELQVNGPGTGRTAYALVRSSVSGGEVWNTLSGGFQVWSDAAYAGYPVSLVEQGSSNYYVGNFPPAIPAGLFSVSAHQQLGGSPAVSDPTFGFGDFNWNGSYPIPLSDLATSGQLGAIAPIKVAKGVAISGFLFQMVSSADHVTPFTSGILSGQASRNGGAFGALQSGSFKEVGLGWYSINLTSGDLNGGTVALNFTAVGISGGAADPRNFGFVMQLVSGST